MSVVAVIAKFTPGINYIQTYPQRNHPIGKPKEDGIKANHIPNFYGN